MAIDSIRKEAFESGDTGMKSVCTYFNNEINGLIDFYTSIYIYVYKCIDIYF